MLKSTKKPNQSNFLGMLKTPANAGAKAYCQNGLDAYEQNKRLAEIRLNDLQLNKE